MVDPLTAIMLVVVTIWGERRLLARFQQRSGPNRWGPLLFLNVPS